jgi:hypothetical protein
MQLVQILVPLFDNDGEALPREHFARVRDELTERFGGLTAFTRSPAEGLWRAEGERTARDDVVLFEVMAEQLDAAWWGAYRRELEKRFRQDAVLIPATEVRVL